MSTEISATKSFDGKVVHIHCDPLPAESTLSFNFPSTGSTTFGVFTPDIFLVVSSADLMNAVQDQLRRHLTSQYKAETVTLQLGDSAGEMGSEMLSSNLATRLSQFIQLFRTQSAAAYRDTHGASSINSGVQLAPTSAGLRLYAKLPDIKDKPEETKAKLRELAIKYGAIAADGEEIRDVSDLDVTVKVNIFGSYNGKFYLNYRLVAPFRHKDKPEILAEQPKKGRKRSATESGAAPAKKARAPAAKKGVDGVKPEDFDNEDDLCMAYVKAGVPLRSAAQLALKHFEGRGSDDTDGAAMPAFQAVSGCGGAGAGAAAADDEDA
jgi:hypothetical protein